MVSGGFDPLHSGHIAYLRGASKFGVVIVALNSDDWLKRKKGYAFMQFEERRLILENLAMVKQVVPVDDSDGTVAAAIREHRPTMFANGGDRKEPNEKELLACIETGVGLLFGVGGEKIASSSELVRRVR